MSIDLEAIRARADTATPGPWKIGRQSPSGAQNVGTLHGILTAQTTSKENADFVAHAREDIPALLAEVERLQSELATVTTERDAAVEDLTLSNTRKFNNPCEFCKKSGKNCAPVDIQDVCKAWEWRGERSE